MRIKLILQNLKTLKKYIHYIGKYTNVIYETFSTSIYYLKNGFLTIKRIHRRNKLKSILIYKRI